MSVHFQYIVDLELELFKSIFAEYMRWRQIFEVISVILIEFLKKTLYIYALQPIFFRIWKRHMISYFGVNKNIDSSNSKATFFTYVYE